MSNTLLARAHPSSTVSGDTELIEVRLHASLHETISEINVTEIVMRSTVRRDELDLLPALPLLAKNISDSGMPAEGAAPLMAPRLMRFVSDQGTDRGPVPEAVSSRYLPVVLASGCGEAWRIALRMQDWSVPLHKDVQSFEINAKLNFTFESGFSMSVFMTMDYCVDRYARGRTCTAFCSISSKSVAGESVYCQLLQPIISDMHTMTLAALSDAHSSLLTYVVDLASSLSAAMEVEGALAAISLALQRPQQRSSLSADFSLKILVMIGQLVEIFFRSRKDEYQTHVSAAESFRRKPQLLRRCQVLCGALGAGLWDTIEVLDKNLLKNFAQSNDFAVSRLLRMGVMFLFHGDVNSIVPCFRAITSPALFNEFSSGASVAHNAYDVVFHDWHLGLRMKSINKSVDRVVKLFAPYNSLLLSNRNAFSVEAITCLQSFRQVLVDFRRILETVNMLTERWDYEFADSFTSDDSFGHPMKSGDLCKDLQALKQPSDGSSRVRKAYVEAQYASSKLFEAFGLTLRASQEFSAGKARNDQFRVLGYAEGAFNYLAEFRSVSEAQLTLVDFGTITPWCGDGYKGEYPVATDEPTQYSAVRLKNPQNICCLKDGSLMIVDCGNHSILSMTTAHNCQRIVNSKTLRVVALNRPRAIIPFDDKGSFLIADTANHCIRLLQTNVVADKPLLSDIAGTCGNAGRMNGPGTVASFFFPTDIAMFRGKCVVCDKNNHVIRAITVVDANPVKSAVVTIAGIIGTKGNVDGSTTSFEDFFKTAKKNTTSNKALNTNNEQGARLCNPSAIVSAADDSCLYFCEQTPPSIRRYDGNNVTTLLRGAPLRVPSAMCLYCNHNGRGASLLIADQEARCIWKFELETNELTPFVTAMHMIHFAGLCGGMDSEHFMPTGLKSPRPGCVVFSDGGRNQIFRFLDEGMCAEADQILKARMKEDDEFYHVFLDALHSFSFNLTDVVQKIEDVVYSLVSNKHLLACQRYTSTVEHIIKSKGRFCNDSLDVLKILILAAPSVKSVKDSMRTYRFFDRTTNGINKDIYNVLVTKLSRVEFDNPYMVLEDEMSGLADILSMPELSNREAQEIICTILRSDKFVFPLSEATLKVIGTALNREKFTFDRVMVGDMRRETVRWLNRLDTFAVVSKRVEDHSLNVQHFVKLWHRQFVAQKSLGLMKSMVAERALNWLCRVHMDSIALFPALYQVNVMDNGKELQASQSFDRSIMTVSALQDVVRAIEDSIQLYGDTIGPYPIIPVIRSVLIEAANNANLSSVILILLDQSVEAIRAACNNSPENLSIFSALFSYFHSELLVSTLDKHYNVIIDRVAQQTAAVPLRREPREPREPRGRLGKTLAERPGLDDMSVKAEPKIKDPDTDLRGHLLMYEPGLWTNFLSFWDANSEAVSSLLIRFVENPSICESFDSFFGVNVLSRLAAHYSTLFRLFSLNWKEVVSGMITVDAFKRINGNRQELYLAWVTVDPSAKDDILSVLEDMDSEIQNYYASVNALSSVVTSLAPSFQLEGTLIEALKKNWGGIRVCDIRFAFNATVPDKVVNFNKVAGLTSEDVSSLPVDCMMLCFPPKLLTALDWLNFCVSEGSFFMDFWQDNCSGGDSANIAAIFDMWYGLWERLSSSEITFSEMEKYITYILDRKEVSCLARSCFNRHISATVDNHFEILLDCDPSAAAAAKAVDSIVNQAERWKHLFKTVTCADQLLANVAALRRFVIQSEDYILLSLGQNISDLRTEYQNSNWAQRTLADSFELCNLARSVDFFLFMVSAELLDTIHNNPTIIDWLRCFTNDDDFRTALEMALGKSEMECPMELWDSVSERVDEQCLSRLRNIRSYLHAYLYGSENIPRTFDLALKVFGQLNENVDPIAISHNIISCEPLCTPLMSLIEVRGYSEGAIPSRLLQLYSPAHHAVWVLAVSPALADQVCMGNIDAVLKLQYVVLNLNNQRIEDGAEVTVQEHSFSELQDFQSTVVLSKVTNANDDFTQQLFLNQFARMGKLSNIVMALYDSGHPKTFPQCRIMVPVSCSVDYFENFLQEWTTELGFWKELISSLKQKYFFVNYYVAKRLQCLIQYLKRFAAEDSGGSDDLSFFVECVALINTSAALDIPYVTDLRDRLVVEWKLCEMDPSPIGDVKSAVAALDKVFVSIPVPERPVMTVPEAAVQMSLATNLFTARGGFTGLHIIECEGYAEASSGLDNEMGDFHQFQRDERTDELLLILSIFAASQRAPETDEILICNERTSLETVENFVHLWAKAHLYGRNSRIFTIVGCYLLQYDIQDVLTILVRELESTAKCPLVISTCPSENNGLLATALSHRPKQRLMALSVSTLRKYVGALGLAHSKGMQLFFSPYSGSGKTFAIRSRSALSGQGYVLCSINSSVESGDVASRLLENIQHSNQAGLSSGTENGLLLHVDISNSATWSVCECLFRLCFLGILCDPAQNTFYIWDSEKTSFCIEVASDVLDSVKSFLTTFPNQLVVASELSFCCEKGALLAGMGGEMFSSSLYDATSSSVEKTLHDAHHRLRFVYSVLATIRSKKGSFPYSLADCFLSPTEADNGSRCYKLLLEASQLKVNTSLHCLWSFVNVVFWQLNEMHHPESPLNAACMPDPLSHSIDDTENKAKIKGQIIEFIFKTAREFATRLTGVVLGRRISQCKVSGLSRNQFNNRWQRCYFDNDGEPCFSLGRNEFFLYYRRKGNCWVIDDIIEPEGPVYSISSSKDLSTAHWTTSPGWESSRRSIGSAKCPGTKGYRGEGVMISGCGIVRQNGSCSSAEDGLYLRQQELINGQPHYIKEFPNENKRRHLFWETDKGCWQISDICNDDQGAHVMCPEKQAIESSYGDWRFIPPDVVEKKPVFEMLYEDSDSSAASAVSNSMAADQIGEIAAVGLHIELLRWQDSNHECIFFNNENHLVTFLSMNPAVLRRTMHPSLLKHLENNRIIVGDDLTSIASSPRHFQKILGGLTGVVRSDADATSLIDGYCMTGDSLLKMLAIVYRIRCGVPVVLMGECGCGKTMLISYLTKWLGVRLITLDIHGGTTEEDVLAVFAEAKTHLYTVASVAKPSTLANDVNQSDVYIFLDEVNTCAHMGVIAEAICHRTMNGVRLPEGIKILAALNPYRLRPEPPAGEEKGKGLNYSNNSTLPTSVRSSRSSRKKIQAGHDPMRRLVYRVHPIPRLLQDFIFDFGALDYKTERMYISFMIKKTLPRYDLLEQEFATEVISGSQFAIRGFDGDNSAVSLRDVKRCLGLIEWFANYWPGGPKARVHISLFGRSLVLAIAHVYLYRLSSSQLRGQFWSKMAAIARDFGRNLEKIQCSELCNSNFPQTVLKRVQKNFSDAFTIDSGIAMNEALTENIYVIVVCILNKIPVFVVGKPGTSKTLALQVIASNLQGAQSPHKTWRRFPAVYLFQYQCSPLSTAKSINFQFEAAKSYQSSAQDVITVLLLDEVGLAEHSPDMPLKVLHYMLVDPPIGIVGLSNWTLDSSKMNRAICLQRPEPSVDDMMMTGQNIICTADVDAAADEAAVPLPSLSRQSSNPGLRKISVWLINLSRAFHKIYQAQSENSKGREFIGMRDYYCLLKMFRADLGTNDNSNAGLYQISVPKVLYNVCRNLGGKPNTMDYILSTFYMECFEQRTYLNSSFQSRYEAIKDLAPNHLTLIRDSLNELHNRHLMLLTRNSAALSLLFSCNLLYESDVTVLIGSRFQKDLAELRLIQQINEIKNAMLEGRVVILLNHDSIYESLYDVLNQRYVTRTDPVTGKVRRMLRLAIGPRSQLCPVTDGFKIVVIVEQFHAYDNLDLPLLNRFEKQVFLYDSVLSDGEKNCVTAVTNWAMSLLDDTDLTSLDQLFAGYHAETIPSLILYLSKKLPGDKDLLDMTSVIVVELLDTAKEMLLHISLPIVTLKFPNLLSVSGEKQSISIDLLASLKEHFGYDNASDNTLSETANRGMLTVVMTHSPVGHFTLCKLAHETSLGIQSCELKEIQLSLISSEKQITDLLEDYYSCSSINLGGVENKLLCILCDPLENDLSIIAHVKYLCAKFNSIFVKRHSKLSRAAQQRVFRHVAVVVHLPPGINNLVGRRDYTVDFQAPWAYEFIDDIRPMTNESINEMRDLTTKSAFDLCKKGGIIDLKEVMSSKFQSALARCIAPPIAQCYNYTKKLIPSIQIVKFLLRFPEFMNFLELAVLTCLESCSSSALEQSGRPLLHVEIACTDVFVAGTLREALYSALESVIVQAMSHTLRNIDKNFNLHILGHIAERYVRIPAGASLELTDEDSTNVKIWLSLCSRLLDLSAIGRSCTIVFPSEVHLMDATIVNTGLHEGGLMCRFPFSERIMMLLGADETRRNIEKVAEDIVPGGSMISSVMIKPLRAVLGSFLGGTFWADTVSLISNKERFSSDYSYVNDFIACRVTPFKCLSLDDHVDVFRFLTLATTHLPDEHLDLNLDPVLVQASFWANDTRYFHILSALSTVLKSDASFQILKQNLCERLSVMSRAKCAPGFDNSFSYLIEVDSDICNFFFNYLLHLLEISLKSDDWIALANWEKLYFAMLPDLEGLILGLLSSLSNDRVLPNHDASGVKKLARSVIFPFRTLKAAAIIISEFKIEFSLDLNHTAVQDCVDLLSAALRADILSLERGEKSPMIALCLNKLNKEGMYSVCCSILRRVFTDIVESEYQFFFASAFQLSVTDDLLAQLHNCVVISSTKSQSGDKKLIWLSLAKSLYCFLFSNMRGDFIIHNFLVNRVLEDCEVSVTIVQLYLQWLLDFNELEGRVKQTDPYFSLLPQDSTIFEKVKMFGVARLLLDRFCDNLLQFIGDAGDRIVGSDISAAVIPSDETAILLRNLEANYYVLRCIICRGGAQTMISYLSGRNLPAQFDGMSSLAEVAHKATMINPLACMSLPCTENFAHAVRVVERVLYNSVPVTALTDLIISDEKLQELTITSRISILVAAFSTVIIEAKRNSFPMGSNTATVMQWVTDIRMNSKVNDNIVHNNFKLIVNWILVGQKSYSEDIDVNCKGSWSANRRSLEAHICALVVEFPKCWIATLLISAERFKDYLVPSMPNDELLVLAKALGYVGWYTCVNGHPYVVGNCTYPMETARCSICNSRIGGENHETVVGTKRFDPHSRPQCMGYNLTAAKHSDAYDLQDGSRCNAVTSTILRYIIHLSLAMSMSLSEANALSVHEFLGIKGFNPLNAYKELVTLMEKDWAELKKRSSYGDADLSMALHLTLDLYAMEIRKGNFSSISYRLDTEDARDIFERSFEAICRRYFMQSSSLSEIREAASTLSGLSQFTAIRKCLGNAEASVYLTGENELSIQQLMNARLLRYRESVNFNAFMFHFGLQRENTFMFPLLSAILKTEEKLSLIKHISDILAWHSVLFRALKPGSVTRSEALNISNAGVISNLPIDNQAAASLILDKYCVAFNRTLPLVPFLFECNANPFLASNNEVDLSGSQRSDGSGDRMSPNTSIKFSLPSIISGEQDATGLCTIQIINALMQTHNDVLEGLISLAAPISSKDFTKEGVKITETLAPLAKGKKKKVAVTTFRTDLNVLNRRLIHYDRKIHLMPIVYAFAKQNLGCTEGSLDGFDYSRIEQSLSRSLLGTAELINVHVTQFQYAGELQNTGVLRMLQERVLQEPLSLSLLERIQREVDTKVRLVRLLTQVEECVAFVVSTGNTGVMDVDSTMLLETYINDILLVSKASWAEISCPTISAHVQLCHLRALLQALELWLLGDPLDAVVLRYKESFEGVVSDEDLRAVAAAEGSTVLMAGLFDVLTEQLCRDTWPANACLKEYVGYRDEDICNLLAYEIFPDVLCLCHAHAVYKFIQSLSAS